MTFPTRHIDPRSPIDTRFARVRLGTFWLPNVVSPTPPVTPLSVTAIAVPSDLTFGAVILNGTDVYLQPLGGTDGTVYRYALSVSLSDGTTGQQSVYQPCQADL